MDYKGKNGTFVIGELETQRLDASDPGLVRAAIDRAASLLRDGGTVAFPTETVYGLGANALDPSAITRIFVAKQRPDWDPLIVHIADAAMLEQVATLGPVFATRVQTLMAAFWPGPLTLLLPRTPQIPDAVTAGRPLVGVRQPAHPVAQALIRGAGVPIAAPSANRFGHTSPTTAAHVLDDLDTRIDAVLDGGPTAVGLESTVLDPTQWPMVLYRQGAVTVEQIRALCGPESVSVFRPGPAPAAPVSLPSPGVGLRHYAPNARLILIAVNQTDPVHDLLKPATAELRVGKKVGAMLPDLWALPPGISFFLWGSWNDPETLARTLFAGLRALDDRSVDVILCPIPPGAGVSAAIRDRLEKAARS